ncbi:MAG: tetratricopeptide repeat protein [Planctomycetes bacterium]|nr:tetratricopeptide repeat protein [Planctomycetota bacterium]
MTEPPRRSPAEADAILSAEFARIGTHRDALGETGAAAVAGWTLMHGMEWEAAAIAWEMAAKGDPDDPEPLNEWGVCLLELGRFDEAANLFRRTIDVDARLVAAGRDGVEWMENDPAYRLGVALHAKGDLRSAIASYEDSARRNPTGVDALREAARSRLALGEPEAALEVLGRLERRTVRLTLRAEVMAMRADANRMLRERGT